MSRCAEMRGKMSQLNRERGVRKSSQMPVNVYSTPPPFWLLKVSLEKKCSKERKNLQMFDAVLLTVISAKAAKREARDGLTVDSQGEK